MLTKKRIGIACLVIFTVIGSGVFLLYHPKSADQIEAESYVDKLYSFSGKLTPAEKKDFLNTVFALEKLTANLNDPSEMDRWIPPSEFDKLLEHTEELMRENPDIKPPPHSHVHEQEHEGIYQQQEIIDEELAKINAAIEEVKASDASESAKKALLSVFEHRRAVLLDSGKTTRKMEKLLEEIKKTEPDVEGLDWGPHGYKKIYEHHLEIKKRRTHHPDGSVEEELRSTHFGSSDPVLQRALEKYIEELKWTPPWKSHPLPPQHEDLRYFVEYEDVYVDEEGKRIPNPSPQTPDQKKDMPSEVPTGNPSEEIPPELSQENPELIITQEEVDSWQGSLDTLEVDEIEKIESLFEQAVGIPLNRFLEMSDAEIEAEFKRQFNFSPSSTDIEMTLGEEFEKFMTPSENESSLSVRARFESNLREKYSPLRFKQAIAILNHHGPEVGLRRLQEIDPEVAADVQRFLQKQQEE